MIEYRSNTDAAATTQVVCRVQLDQRRRLMVQSELFDSISLQMLNLASTSTFTFFETTRQLATSPSSSTVAPVSRELFGSICDPLWSADVCVAVGTKHGDVVLRSMSNCSQPRVLVDAVTDSRSEPIVAVRFLAPTLNRIAVVTADGTLLLMSQFDRSPTKLIRQRLVVVLFTSFRVSKWCL